MTSPSEAAAPLQAAATEVLRQRAQARLERFFQQAPSPLCILDEPDFAYELVNPAYQRLFSGRHLLGKPVRAALPDHQHGGVGR